MAIDPCHNIILAGGATMRLSDVPAQSLTSLKKLLTWQLPTTAYGPGEYVYGYVEDIGAQTITVPRSAATWQELASLPVVDCRSDGRDLGTVASAATPITMRNDKQLRFMEPMWNAFQAGDSIYGVAGPGTGKTVMAIELLRRYGRSAAVVVHKDFLMEQWTERIHSFWPEARVGVCQQDRCDTGNTHDIVLCMVQSLSKRDYTTEFWNSFGVVVWDEFHRMGSEMWNPVLYKFEARVYMMLSATPERHDGMHNLQFLQGAYPTVVIGESDLTARVETRWTGVEIAKEQYTTRWNGQTNWSKMISILAAHKDRNLLIAKDIASAAKAGRKCLVISERLEQLRLLEEWLRLGLYTKFVTGGQYVGGRSREQRALIANCQVIYTTYQLANEGLDIPELSALFVASPRWDMVQAVGRILRYTPEKGVLDIPAIVVDYQDNVPELLGLGTKRRRTYTQMGCDVRPFRR